jgi:hypothetical protein
MPARSGHQRAKNIDYDDDDYYSGDDYYEEAEGGQDGMLHKLLAKVSANGNVETSPEDRGTSQRRCKYEEYHFGEHMNIN